MKKYSSGSEYVTVVGPSPEEVITKKRKTHEYILNKFYSEEEMIKLEAVYNTLGEEAAERELQTLLYAKGMSKDYEGSFLLSGWDRLLYLVAGGALFNLINYLSSVGG